jgi:ATP-dependent protease ClpP protease subunit
VTQQIYPIKCRIRDEDGGMTRVDVYDDIGGGGWLDEGVTAKSFAAQMAKVKGPLDVHINSGGGEVHDGVAIGNAIRNHKGSKRTVVDGIAASIASVIFQAGDERVVEPGAMVMVHDASTVCWGTEEDMAKTAEVLGKNSDNIAQIYADRAGGTAQQWRDTMRKETWYTADEAVAAGLADKIGTGEAELPAGLDIAAFAAMPGRIAARLRAMPQAAAPRAAGSSAAADEDGTHATMKGSHGHSHPAFGSQGGDSDHAHDHSHDGDASHDHSHADGTGNHAPAVIAGDTQAACGPDCARGGQPPGTQDAAAFRSWLKKEIRGVLKKEIRAAARARPQARPDDGDAAADNHSHEDISGIDLEQIRAALKGANK